MTKDSRLLSDGHKKRVRASYQFHVTSQHHLRGILKLFILVKHKYGKIFQKLTDLLSYMEKVEGDM